MNRFFAEPANICGNKAALYGDDVKHISSVLRLRIGDEIMLCDGNGTDYAANITSITKQCVELEISASSPALTEPKTRITLFQGLPKAGKLESIIQKCVELGITAVVPVAFERSVVRLGKKDFEAKRTRYQRVAAEAAKQSRRGTIPTVEGLITPDEIDPNKFDALLLAYECERENSIKTVLCKLNENCRSIGIIVGPEGGVSEEEAAMFCKKGAVPFSLGRRILRTETAGPAICAITLYHLEGEA